MMSTAETPPQAVTADDLRPDETVAAETDAANRTVTTVKRKPASGQWAASVPPVQPDGIVAAGDKAPPPPPKGFVYVMPDVAAPWWRNTICTMGDRHEWEEVETTTKSSAKCAAATTGVCGIISCIFCWPCLLCLPCVALAATVDHKLVCSKCGMETDRDGRMTQRPNRQSCTEEYEECDPALLLIPDGALDLPAGRTADKGCVLYVAPAPESL